MMYLLKMLICSGILFGYYRLALYNERFHQWNRFYLLAAMFLSVVVPLLSIPVFATEEPGNVEVIIASMPWNVTVERAPVETGLPWRDMLVLAASTISIALFLKVVINIARLFITYKTNPVNKLDDKVDLVFTQLKHAPFSFFNWLFWRQDIDPSSDNGQRMLTHELTHIRENHSADKIFTEVLMCVFWMNPFFWLMRRELGTIHEFLADRRAIGKQDGAAFAAMILHALQLQPASTSGLVNPFFSSQIKRRLQMITTSKEPRYSYLRRISGFVLMISSAIMLTLSIQQAKAQTKKLRDNKAHAQAHQDTLKERRTNSLTVNKKGELIMTESDSIIVDAITTSGEKIKVKFGAGNHGRIIPNDDSLTTLVAGEIKTTASKIIIENEKANPPLYLVDGKELFARISPADIQSVNVLKGENASAYGDKGKNGVINITLKNKLQEVTIIGRSSKDPADAKSTGESKDVGRLVEGVVVNYGNGATKPTLIVVDGKQISEEELSRIDPKTIEKIAVSKGAVAIEKYGEKAKDGVIEIVVKGVQIDNKVFTRVEQPAQFPGGEAAWKTYLEKNLRYPEAAQKEGKEGIARVRFIIDPEGNVHTVKILSAPTKEIGEEAMRLIQQGPKWQPAIQNGKKVAFSVDMSIDFKTNKFF